MMPFSSVAMIEKLALFRIALCKAPVLSRASSRCTSILAASEPASLSRAAESGFVASMAQTSVQFVKVVTAIQEGVVALPALPATDAVRADVEPAVNARTVRKLYPAGSPFSVRQRTQQP